MATSPWMMILGSYLNLWRLILCQIITLKKVLQKLLWWLILVSVMFPFVCSLFFWSHSLWLPLFVWARVSYFWIYKGFIILGMVFNLRCYTNFPFHTQLVSSNIYDCTCPAKAHAIFVPNLPMNATVEQLEAVFNNFGPIKHNGIQVRSSKVCFIFNFVNSI